MIKHLDDMVVMAARKGKKRLVVAYAQDSHTLEAVNDAVQSGLVDATLVGDPAAIESVCKQEGIDYNQFTVVAESDDRRCVEIAVSMVSEGKGDLLMKGLVPTDRYMKGILSKQYGLVPPKGMLSHITVIEVPSYHKLLILTDVAIIPYPDLGQKTAMARNLIQTARTLGIERPKLAFIAPSEQLLPSVPSSVEAALLAKMGERGQLGKDIEAEGPLSLDLAICAEAAKTKKLGGNGNVAGDADCLLFPNIDAGNVFFKTCTKFCGAQLAAMVVGAKVPCVLTSRADTRRSKLYSIALACISAR